MLILTLAIRQAQGKLSKGVLGQGTPAELVLIPFLAILANVVLLWMEG